eukprot:297061-Rhodomonas_salina.2
MNGAQAFHEPHASSTLGGAPQTASSFSRMARTEESLRALKRRCVSESTAWGRSSRFASSTWWW